MSRGRVGDNKGILNNNLSPGGGSSDFGFLFPSTSDALAIENYVHVTTCGVSKTGEGMRKVSGLNHAYVDFTASFNAT